MRHQIDDLCSVPWGQPWIEGEFTRLHGLYIICHNRHHDVVSSGLIQPWLLFTDCSMETVVYGTMAPQIMYGINCGVR